MSSSEMYNLLLQYTRWRNAYVLDEMFKTHISGETPSGWTVGQGPGSYSELADEEPICRIRTEEVLSYSRYTESSTPVELKFQRMLALNQVSLSSFVWIRNSQYRRGIHYGTHYQYLLLASERECAIIIREMCDLVDNLVMDSPERLRVVIQHGLLEIMCSYIMQEDFQVKKVAALVLSNCAALSSDEVYQFVRI